MDVTVRVTVGGQDPALSDGVRKQIQNGRDDNNGLLTREAYRMSRHNSPTVAAKFSTSARQPQVWASSDSLHQVSPGQVHCGDPEHT